MALCSPSVSVHSPCPATGAPWLGWHSRTERARETRAARACEAWDTRRATTRWRMRIAQATPCTPARVSANCASSRANRRKRAAQAVRRSTPQRLGRSTKPVFAWATAQLRVAYGIGLAAVLRPVIARPRATFGRRWPGAAREQSRRGLRSPSGGQPQHRPEGMAHRCTPTGLHPPLALGVHVCHGGRACGIRRHAAPACTIQRQPLHTSRLLWSRRGTSAVRRVTEGATKAHASSRPSVRCTLRALLPMEPHRDKVHNTLSSISRNSRWPSAR
jgi:hypothetical protein